MTDKVFLVSIPIAGSIERYIKAENEEDAISAAMDDAWSNGVFTRTKTRNGWEWIDLDVYEKIVEGNFVYIDVYEATASESDMSMKEYEEYYAGMDEDE
jgi:hypothetical protein